jgi:hypothetical protein
MDVRMYELNRCGIGGIHCTCCNPCKSSDRMSRKKTLRIRMGKQARTRSSRRAFKIEMAAE